MLLARCCVYLCLAAAALQAGAPAPSPSAAEIMQRVGENQDREQEQRKGFVYDERIRVTSRYGNGKIARDETAQYIVAPNAKGAAHTRVAISGAYCRKGHCSTFSGDPLPDPDGLDAGIVGSFRAHLTEDDSKDGYEKDYFPLTTEQQKNLEFKIDGERTVEGRPAYVIRFRPKLRKDYGWAGEALIDKEEFQPVTIYTQMARKLPFFVRTMLGTDVPGLGFTTRYKRVEKNLWFPSSFGTEFEVHAVYFFKRTISISMESNNFRHTDVDAQIRYEPVQ